MIVFWVLLALVAIRVVFVLGFAYVLVPYGRCCPACGGETVRIRSDGPIALLPSIERRWCVECGWSWFRRKRPPKSAVEELAGSARPSSASGRSVRSRLDDQEAAGRA
jgi:hypothetical protein